MVMAGAATYEGDRDLAVRLAAIAVFVPVLLVAIDRLGLVGAQSLLDLGRSSLEVAPAATPARIHGRIRGSDATPM